MPTVGHILYIPGILLLGIAIGFVWGAKAARRELAEQQERRRK